MRCIRKGDYGPEVGILQRCLKVRGYYTGQIDNSFGYYTDLALRHYQTDNGLLADGYCCTLTWAEINKDCGTAPSPTPTPTPAPTTTVCGCNAPFYKQLTNYTCGVETIQMIAACYGLFPSDSKIISIAGTNQQNGTGHAGMKAAFKAIGFSYAESFYLKDLPWSEVKNKLKAGYQLAANVMTGGLVGWQGNYPHWVVIRCVGDTSVKINDPTKGVVTHSRTSFTTALNQNGNPDFVLVKK